LDVLRVWLAQVVDVEGDADLADAGCDFVVGLSITLVLRQMENNNTRHWR
jgi:hypothetical protein